MNKTQIISQIANEKLVERVINKIDSTIMANCPDLANDIYLSLMEKDNDTIISLFESGQLAFFIIRMVKNNIFSSNSHTTEYIRNTKKTKLYLMNILNQLQDEMEPDVLVDSEEIYNIKDIILHTLDENDRIVFLLYLEYNSMGKVAKMLHVSTTTIYYLIRKVREQIKEELKKRGL